MSWFLRRARRDAVGWLAGIGAAGFTALVVLSAPRPAAACGPTPNAWWSFGSSLPVNGSTAVAIDGVIVLSMRPFASILPARSTDELTLTSRNDPRAVEVRLSDGAGAEIAGDVRSFGGRFDPVVVFQPKAPLLPDASYRLSAVVHNEQSLAPRPPSATGETTLEMAFTTGTARTPALVSAGKLRAEVEVYDVQPPTDEVCPGPAFKPHQAYRARLTLPVVTGGSAAVDYDVNLRVVRTQPPQPSPPGYPHAKLAPGATKELIVPLTSSEAGGTFCLEVRIEDATGASVEPAPLCLPALAAPSSAAAGCSFLPAPAVGGGAGLAGLIAMAIVLVSGRRRHR